MTGVGNVKIVEMLIKHGADINARGYNGETALQKAILYSQFIYLISFIFLSVDFTMNR